MKVKLLSLFLCLLCFVSAFSVTALAEEAQAPAITINVEERYTDISYMDEVNDPLLEAQRESRTQAGKKTLYIVILVVLLVVAIIILVYNLRKVPAESEISKNDKEKFKQATGITIKSVKKDRTNTKSEIKDKLAGEEEELPDSGSKTDKKDSDLK